MFWQIGENKTINDTVALSKTISLPQFDVARHWTAVEKTMTSTGAYIRLYLFIKFDRSSGFYMLNIFTPSILIVVISWVSFWLNREAAPARVALGVTTVLTMTTLMTTTNAQMPKVSYVKAIDVYLGTCFLMVFAALIEYACVTYLSKKLKMKRERRAKQDQDADAKSPVPMQAPTEYPMFPTAITASDRTGVSPACGLRFRGSPPLDYGGTFVHAAHCECEMSNSTAPFIVRMPKPKKVRRKRKWQITPSTIDKYSRIGFPVGFCLFNDGYSISDVQPYWGKGSASVKLSKEVRSEGTLSTFELGRLVVEDKPTTTSTGQYVTLHLSIVFYRNIGFYVATVYLPAIFVVMISWVAFWIAYDSAPARTLLGIMTVLTMTTLLTNTNRQLPPVSYLKAIDIFLGMCYFSVVAALLEYACVGYSLKKKSDRERKVRKKEIEQKRVLAEYERARGRQPTIQETSFTDQSHMQLRHRLVPDANQTASTSTAPISYMEIVPKTNNAPALPPCTCHVPSPAPVSHVLGNHLPSTPTHHHGNQATTPQQHNPYQLVTAGQYDHIGFDDDLWPPLPPSPPPKKSLWRRIRSWKFEVEPANLDKWSQICFPLLFIILNCLYWFWLWNERWTQKRAELQMGNDEDES